MCQLDTSIEYHSSNVKEFGCQIILSVLIILELFSVVSPAAMWFWISLFAPKSGGILLRGIPYFSLLLCLPWISYIDYSTFC